MSTPWNTATVASQRTLSHLTDRLLSGDSDVLGDILLALGPRAERVVRGRLGGRLTEADYEDALSIALYKLWDRRALFDRARAKLDRWFYVLVRNAAVDLLRHRARHPEDLLGDEVERVPTPVAEQGRKDAALHRDLRRALEHISEVDQRILTSGLTESELSRELSLTPGAIRVRRLRSKQRLRSLLRQMGHL